MATAVTFSAPSSSSLSSADIDTFLGADFTNIGSNISDYRSPDCENMVRDVPGKVRKSMGYFTVKTYADKINGRYYLRTSDKSLIHSGTKIYDADTDEVLFSGMKDDYSHSWQFDDKLFIIDGQSLLVYDGTTVSKVTDNPYVPLVTIGKSPAGGGTVYEDLNLVGSGFKESFLGTAGTVAYQLTFSGLDSTLVTAQVMNSSGTWVDKVENTDFTVDRTNGIVTFVTAPGASPISGEDNVIITAYRTVEGYADRINLCTVGSLFGVAGASDRLFLSGNPTSDFINYDWYCSYNDPTYWPDTSYSKLGSAASAVVGYATIGNYLAAFKDEKEPQKSIILRAGSLDDDGEATFYIANTLQGPGAIAKNSFAYLQTEPLFLTRSGVYAITASDVTGEKYSQSRSFYLDGKLKEENNLENAFACVFNDMYLLCLNNKIYILDGLQATSTDASAPYSTRQYVGFYRTNVPARCMWTDDGKLYFGATNGKVYQFYTDPTALSSYNDDGVKITARWTTPDFDGKLFYKNKTFKYLAVRVGSSVSTTVDVYAQKRGIWSLIKHDSKSAKYFSFAQLTFSKLSFKTDTTQKIISTKLRIKKVDKAAFKIENASLNEPFALYNVAFEYTEKGNNRR